MAIGFDAASSIVVGTGDRSWSHNPVGTPKGVLVIIVHEVGTDTVTGVTYDGTALVEVPLSPLLHTSPETGSVHAFFLGTGVPTTDPANVAVDVSDTSDWIGAAFTVTATGDTEVHDTTTFDSGATTAPSATLTITKDSFVAGGLYSGLAAPGSTEVAGTTEVITGDLGADSGEISRGDSIKTTDFAYGWTQASDDGAVLAIAISESANRTFNAEVATATGTANAVTTLVTANLGVATGTGAALDATVQTAVTANAGVATATGLANDVTTLIKASAGVATGTGAALAPSATIEVNPGVAAATGLANDATAEVSGGAVAWGAWSETWSNEVDLVTVNAGLATGTGLANDATTLTTVNAGVATAIAAAYDATGQVGAYAQLATGVGTAYDATISTGAPPGGGPAKRRRGGRPGQRKPAEPLGPIMFAVPETVVRAGLATGTGTAHDATITWDDDETALLLLLAALG